MEVIKHSTGKNIGQISIKNTIATMEVGESWLANADEIKLTYAQVCCSKYRVETGRQFHVSSTKEDAGQITITRIK